MKKTVTGIDESLIENKKDRIVDYQTMLEVVKNEYNKLGLRPLKESDLALIFKGDDFIKEIMIEKVEMPQNIDANISKEKYKNNIKGLLEMPDTRMFNKSVAELLEYSQSYNSRSTYALSMNDFSIEMDEIVIKKEAISNIELSGTYFAEDSNEEAIYEATKKLVDALNESVETNKKFQLFNRNTISTSLVEFHEQSYLFKPNPREIKGLAARIRG